MKFGHEAKRETFVPSSYFRERVCNDFPRGGYKLRRTEALDTDAFFYGTSQNV